MLARWLGLDLTVVLLAVEGEVEVGRLVARVAVFVLKELLN